MWKAMMFPLALCVAGAPALADPRCGPRQSVLELLESRYQEHPVALGLNQSGRLLEILASERGDTWTVILTRPDGVSCILDAGESWRQRVATNLGPEA